mmetsp:Transcript_63510/g.160222  ORF Transcript_63510/g.160222 Transcript_63510/m.160222 type:complete len:251 (-) Transcript_63510:426-1178(-)
MCADEPCRPKAGAKPSDGRSQMKLLSVEVLTNFAGKSEVHSLPQFATVKDLQNLLSANKTKGTVLRLVHQNKVLDNVTKLQDLGLDRDNKLKLQQVVQKTVRPAKPDDAPAYENLQDDRASVQWLLRADRILCERSNERQKLSKFFEAERHGTKWKGRLKLLPTERSFGESNGYGRVQVCFDEEWPDSTPPPFVSIRVGDKAWEISQQAILTGVKPIFELTGAQWDFRNAAETISFGVRLLTIVVELEWR